MSNTSFFAPPVTSYTSSSPSALGLVAGPTSLSPPPPAIPVAALPHRARLFTCTHTGGLSGLAIRTLPGAIFSIVGLLPTTTRTGTTLLFLAREETFLPQGF